MHCEINLLVALQVWESEKRRASKHGKIIMIIITLQVYIKRNVYEWGKKENVINNIKRRNNDFILD